MFYAYAPEHKTLRPVTGFNPSSPLAWRVGDEVQIHFTAPLLANPEIKVVEIYNRFGEGWRISLNPTHHSYDATAPGLARIGGRVEEQLRASKDIQSEIDERVVANQRLVTIEDAMLLKDTELASLVSRLFAAGDIPQVRFSKGVTLTAVSDDCANGFKLILPQS